MHNSFETMPLTRAPAGLGTHSPCLTPEASRRPHLLGSIEFADLNLEVKFNHFQDVLCRDVRRLSYTASEAGN